jgi:hypothetical protein
LPWISFFIKTNVTHRLSRSFHLWNNGVASILILRKGAPMFTAENCPYIVIGVPAFAPKSEGAVGFALATKRVRSNSDAPFAIEDLTAALSRFEAGDAGGQLMYALPADFDLFEGREPTLSSGKTPDSIEELLQVSAEEFSEEDRESIALLLLRRGLESLLKWNWSESDRLLKECLRISRSERNRDEALNLIAAALKMQGDNERAIQALNKAVEGQWNLRLQANLALLAIEHDKKKAVEQMSFLVDGAEDAEEKLSAIRMAIGLWRQVQEEELGTDDDEEFNPLPNPLIASIVTTLSSPTIEEEDFFDLGVFLARVSPQSVTREVLNKTAFKGRSTAEIIFARSCEFSYYLDNVVRMSLSDRRRPEFVEFHIDGLVEEVTNGLFDNQEHMASIAFSFLNQGLGVETRQRIWMRAALALLLPKLLGDDGIPHESFIPWITEAKNASRALDLPDELTEMTKELFDTAGDVLVQMQMREFFNLAADVENAVNNMTQQMTGFFNRLSADKQSIRETSQTVIEWCNDQEKMFSSFDQLGIADVDLKNEISQLRRATNDIKQRVLQYL